MKFPTTIIICGITGDLAQKKIIPALFDLYKDGKLGKDFRLVGFSRREMTNTDLRAFIENILCEHGKDCSNAKDFINKISYISGQFDDKNSYQKLAGHLSELDMERKTCSNKLFYFAVPPTLYENLATQISESGLSIPCGGKDGFSRILIEKPFGKDLKTAEHLDALLGKLFQEEQIFRIDHYVAKKALLDLINIHKQDKKFKEKWNNKFIEKVEINLFEKALVGSRGTFYDEVGAFRDVGQNHILQMLSLVAMNIPENPKIKNSAENIQSARAEVLENLLPFGEKELSEMRRGQYVGYLSETGVASNSTTETFFSLTVFVDTENFRGVSFVLTSGKALSKNLTEIVVHFKDWPKFTFNVPAEESQPAYQKILLDCIAGDQTVFTSTREVLSEWKFVTPIVEKTKNLKPFEYKIGAHPEELI
jgi:glucose-6-phosphate 1-dehydrogenase